MNNKIINNINEYLNKLKVYSEDEKRQINLLLKSLHDQYKKDDYFNNLSTFKQIYMIIRDKEEKINTYQEKINLLEYIKRGENE